MNLIYVRALVLLLSVLLTQCSKKTSNSETAAGQVQEGSGFQEGSVVQENDLRTLDCYGPTTPETCHAKGPGYCELWSGDFLIVDEREGSTITNNKSLCVVGKPNTESYCANTALVRSSNPSSSNVFFRGNEYLKITPRIRQLPPESGWTSCSYDDGTQLGCSRCGAFNIF